MADAPLDTPAPGSDDTHYRVLARKYRPTDFSTLVGQEAMVRTLRNALDAGRLAHAFMLTGVRGVGKTTTARIVAKALNCVGPDGKGGPTMDPCGVCANCVAITEDRHVDVIEMDAASRTGINDIRELIEGVRYRPVSARYKVYIIDEVHMLSTAAFNGLLKTLEEPPPHVKFIFATTEIRKVPVTVLSRCQRFDLRRVDVGLLVKHFETIVAKEGASAEPEALAAIARAAEGSVRDGLSLLDQAIAMGSGKVTAQAVRDMLGLADRQRIFDLVELVLGGKPGPAIEALQALHKDGAEPQQVLEDLAECVHIASRIKVGGADAAGEGLSAEERRRAVALAGQLSMPILARAWTMLLKGIEEVARAGDQLAAADMVLIRIAYTADLPTPDAVIRALGNGPAPAAGGGRAAPAAPPTPRGPLNAVPAEATMPRAAPVAQLAPGMPDPKTLQEIVDLAGANREIKLKVDIEDYVELVRFEPGRLEISLGPGAPGNLAGELGERLGRWTGRRWVVMVSREKGSMPIGVARRQAEAAEIERVKGHADVKAVLDAFPDATIKAVRPAKTTKS